MEAEKSGVPVVFARVGAIHSGNGHGPASTNELVKLNLQRNRFASTFTCISQIENASCNRKEKR